MSTTGRPARPVAPATAILVLRCICVSLDWIAPHSGDTPRRGDVTEEQLTAEFEEQRPHLRAVAYRMLGSVSEADDAVQEAWLRASRADTGEIANMRAWLTTVVARVSLDMFAVPFDDIAPIVERSPAATRQLASRARRRVEAEETVPDPDLGRQREVVGAFMAASREGDFEGLVA